MQDMAKDRYQIWYTPAGGSPSPLEAVSADNIQEAELLLGRVVRRRRHELDRDGSVRLTDESGKDVGTVSQVSEHLPAQG